MKYRKWLILAGMAFTLVAAVLITPLVLAQRSPASTAASSGSAVIVPVAASNMNPGFGPGVYAGFASSSTAVAGAQSGGYLNMLISVAANKIGISRSTLITNLQNGQTIAQVAAAHKVSTSSIANAFLADETAILKTEVANGLITQAQANTILTDLKTDVNAWLNETLPFRNCPNMSGNTPSQTNPSSTATSTQ